jgi:hypothetical protein
MAFTIVTSIVFDLPVRAIVPPIRAVGGGVGVVVVSVEAAGGVPAVVVVMICVLPQPENANPRAAVAAVMRLVRFMVRPFLGGLRVEVPAADL